MSSSSSKQKYWCTLAADTLLRHGQHYLEIEVVKMGQKVSPKLAVGLMSFSGGGNPKDVHWQEGKHPIGHAALTTSSSGSLSRYPPKGALPDEGYASWSYLPTAAIKLSSSSNNEGIHYGSIPPLQPGDRIGMLVNITDGTVSFFCNGQDLGIAFTNLTPPLLPAVSVCDKVHLRLLFPAPPYLKRNPRLTLFTVGSSTDLML